MHKEAENLLRKSASLLSAIFIVVIVFHYSETTKKDLVPEHLVFQASGPATFSHFMKEYNLWKLSGGTGAPESCIKGFRVRN